MLNAYTGAVLACVYQREMNRYRLIEFYRQVCEVYPSAQRIWMIQDNSALHFHPDVLVGMDLKNVPSPLLTPRRGRPSHVSSRYDAMGPGGYQSKWFCCLPMLLGSTRLKMCGGNSSRSFCLCTAMLLILLKRFSNESLTFFISGLPVRPRGSRYVGLSREEREEKIA